MATTAAELLALARAEARQHAVPTGTQADAAITALGHAGRALHRLTPNTTDGRYLAERGAVRDAAAAILQASGAWPARPARLPDLVGAACDLITRRELNNAQRWVLATAINRTSRHCADLAQRYGPYARIPLLHQVRTAIIELERHAARHPPSPAAGLLLDLPIPAPFPRDASWATALLEATVALSPALQRERCQGHLSVAAALATAAAGEALARHATVALDGRDGPWRQAPAAWQVVQATLIRFHDGSRGNRAAPSPTVHAARQLQDALNRAASSDTAVAPMALRAVTNQLPLLARHLGLATQRWAHTGALFSRARDLIPTEDLVSAILHNAAVPAGPRQVVPVAAAAHVAERLSAALAHELDRTAPMAGEERRPHLAAAHAALLTRPATVSKDAEWAARLAARVADVAPISGRRV